MSAFAGTSVAHIISSCDIYGRQLSRIRVHSIKPLVSSATASLRLSDIRASPPDRYGAYQVILTLSEYCHPGLFHVLACYQQHANVPVDKGHQVRHHRWCWQSMARPINARRSAIWCKREAYTVKPMGCELYRGVQVDVQRRELVVQNNDSSSASSCCLLRKLCFRRWRLSQ